MGAIPFSSNQAILSGLTQAAVQIHRRLFALPCPLTPRNDPLDICNVLDRLRGLRPWNQSISTCTSQMTHPREMLDITVRFARAPSIARTPWQGTCRSTTRSIRNSGPGERRVWPAPRPRSGATASDQHAQLVRKGMRHASTRVLKLEQRDEDDNLSQHRQEPYQTRVQRMPCTSKTPATGMTWR